MKGSARMRAKNGYWSLPLYAPFQTRNNDAAYGFSRQPRALPDVAVAAETSDDIDTCDSCGVGSILAIIGGETCPPDDHDTAGGAVQGFSRAPQRRLRDGPTSDTRPTIARQLFCW